MNKSMWISILIIGISFAISAESKKNVYVYFKTNLSDSYYYAEKDLFYRTLFGDGYTVTLVHTLRGLSNFEYLITDEVPRNDYELRNLGSYPKEKLLLFSFEPPLFEIRSSDPRYFSYYSKVFTWNDDLIDNIKVFKVRFPWMDPRPMVADRPAFHQKKLCEFVAGRMNWSRPMSNHHARNELVNFFERLGTNEFDLYGPGWQGYRCWKGHISTDGDRRLNKVNIIKNYKFDMCYENAKGLNGWVSERIFEAFAAGCVPVYSGSRNIADYIPKNCFIASQDFGSMQALYTHLKNMSEETYQEYIRNIQEYLASDAAKLVSTPFYIEQIRKVLNLN